MYLIERKKNGKFRFFRNKQLILMYNPDLLPQKDADVRIP